MKRKRYSKEFKARVALAAIKGQKTANELASEYEVPVSQINIWKKRALAALPEVFGQGQQREEAQREAERDRLFQQIGKLHAQDGACVGGTEAQHQPPGPGAQDLSAPTAGSADRAYRPGVVRGHHLHPPGPRVCVPHGRDGLVQPLRARLGCVGYHGGGVLRQCPS